MLIATEGFAAADVEQTYTRARELCRTIGDKTQLFWILRGLWEFNVLHAQLHSAQEIGQQLLSLAIHLQDPDCLLEANSAVEHTQAFLGISIGATAP